MIHGLFLKWAKPGLFLFIFVLFTSTTFTINDKSIDGMLWSRTLGGRTEGAEESTELGLAIPRLMCCLEAKKCTQQVNVCSLIDKSIKERQPQLGSNAMNGLVQL